jgi:hypothetical protein
MDQGPSKFEREATRTPRWLPIAGVVVFLLVVVFVIVFPRPAHCASGGRNLYSALDTSGSVPVTGADASHVEPSEVRGTMEPGGEA